MQPHLLKPDRMLKNTQNKYGALAKSFHWLVAITVVGMFILGIWMVGLGYYDEWNKAAPHYHKSIGILLALVMVLRLFWRIYDPVPKAPAHHTNFEKVAARTTHRLIYLLIFAIMISGYLISTADERAIEVFNWFEIPSLGELFSQQEDIAGVIHEWLAYILIGLASLHALAALKHHFIDKDDTLKRII